jgi:hypothetical protein
LPPGPFLFVRFPAQGLLVAECTARNPGSRIDSVHERVGNEFGGFHQTVTWVRGLPPVELDGLVKGLTARYGSVTVLTRDDALRECTFRLRTPADDDLKAKPLVFLTRFGPQFALWWDHVSAAGYEARAQLESAEQGIEEGQRIQAFYRKAGVHVETRVGELPAGEGATWERLASWRRLPPNPR